MRRLLSFYILRSFVEVNEGLFLRNVAPKELDPQDLLTEIRESDKIKLSPAEVVKLFTEMEKFQENLDSDHY